MPSGSTRIQISTANTQAMRVLARKLREASRRDLQQQLRREIRQAGAPSLQELRAAIRAMPSGGTGHTGLRDAIAASTRLQVLASGVRFRNQLGGSRRNIPSYADDGRWRHPTFGHDPWVPQAGAPGWFNETVSAHEHEFRQACLDAIERVLAELI